MYGSVSTYVQWVYMYRSVALTDHQWHSPTHPLQPPLPLAPCPLPLAPCTVLYVHVHSRTTYGSVAQLVWTGPTNFKLEQGPRRPGTTLGGPLAIITSLSSLFRPRGTSPSRCTTNYTTSAPPTSECSSLRPFSRPGVFISDCASRCLHHLCAFVLDLNFALRLTALFLSVQPPTCCC